MFNRAIATLAQALSVFRHRNYRVYASGNSISLVGMWMQRIAAGWLAWELTGSGAWLGAIAFADLFPTLVIGPIAGAAADRWDRLKLIKLSQALAMGQAAFLFVMTILGLMTIHLLLAATLFLGIVIAFNQPFRFALIPALVPRQSLGSAVAINSVIFNLARFLGPAAAGVIIVSIGTAAAFGINALTYLYFLFMLRRLDVVFAPRSDRKPPKFLTDLMDGFRYTATHETIAMLLILMIVTGIGGRPVIELFPAFADKVFQAGAVGFALLSSSIGIGAIAAGLWLGSREPGAPLVPIALATALLLGVSCAVFTISTSLWAALPVLMVTGFAIAASGIASQTAIQLAVSEDLRGRVMSLFGLIFRGGPAIGAVTMGFASDYVGLALPVFAGAIAVIAAWFAVFTRRHRLDDG